MIRAISVIRGHLGLLQRNHIEPPSLGLRQLKHYAALAEQASELDGLLGTEGAAARLYFESLPGMLKVEDQAEASTFTFDFSHRNRRPPRDPVNAMLSLAYSLLAKDLTVICHAVGFDPFIGFGPIERASA